MKKSLKVGKQRILWGREGKPTELERKRICLSNFSPFSCIALPPAGSLCELGEDLSSYEDVPESFTSCRMT